MLSAVGVGRTLQCPYSSACFEYFHKKFPQARGLFPNDLQHNFSRNVTLLQPFNICSFGNGSTSTATSGSINMCRSFWIHTEDWHHLQLKRLRKKNERGVNRRVRFFVPVEWETWADEACDVFTAPQAHRVWFPAQQKMAGPVTMEEWKFEQLIGSSQGGVLGLLYSASAFKVMSNMFSYNESVDLCCIPKMASGECISPVSHFGKCSQKCIDMFACVECRTFLCPLVHMQLIIINVIMPSNHSQYGMQLHSLNYILYVCMYSETCLRWSLLGSHLSMTTILCGPK